MRMMESWELCPHTCASSRVGDGRVSTVTVRKRSTRGTKDEDKAAIFGEERVNRRSVTLQLWDFPESSGPGVTLLLESPQLPLLAGGPLTSLTSGRSNTL